MAKFQRNRKQKAPKLKHQKTRKEERKEKRKIKKQRRLEYYTNRKNAKQEIVPKKQDTNLSGLTPVPVLKEKKISKDKQLAVQSLKRLPELNHIMESEKRKHLKLQKEMQKQRNKQLQQANLEEDRNIKKLEKQLKLNKRKMKTVPKSFVSEGLDYLLEVCDSETMKGIVAAEEHLGDMKNEFDEDFALMIDHSARIDNEEDISNDESLSESDYSSVEEDIFNESSDNSDKMDENEKINKKTKLEEINGDTSDCDSNTDLDSKDNNTNVNDIHEHTEETWEDIYGRLRGKDGSVIVKDVSKYIPPAKRIKLDNAPDDKQRIEKLSRLKRQLKGLLNRLAEANMHNISTEIEKLYMNNSRHDMNETITNLMLESLASKVTTPERLLIEHILLITILHANVGAEVGAHFLQVIIKQFDTLSNSDQEVENKTLNNTVNIIAQLYNFKIFNSGLLYEILFKLSTKFDEKSIECILTILKNVGFSLRKEDPLALKSLILELQKQASNVPEALKDNSRVKYMLDILLAIKNNNVSKIPNYDNSYSEHLKKLQKNFIRKGNYITQLNILLDDLLQAEERGRWWIVGSAWTNVKDESANTNDQITKSEQYSEKLLKLAKKQRMNTDIRRKIFCTLMTAEDELPIFCPVNENSIAQHIYDVATFVNNKQILDVVRLMVDYMDAFEKLLRLGLKNLQEREIIHVILHCCLQETKFNPYYAVLAQKFCEYHRRYQMIIKCSIWDKLKTVTDCSASQMSNLAKLLTHLFLEKGLPISTLKIVQFSELDKITLRFIRQILLGILLCDDTENCTEVFENIARSGKLKMFRESLRLFIRHFLLKNLTSDSIPENKKTLLKTRADIVEKMLTAFDRRTKL